MRLPAYSAAALACLLLMTGCETPNDVALKVGAAPTDAPALRVAEIRDLPVKDDALVMRSATATLQDLGFTIIESSLDVGVLVGSKQRDAVEKGQVAGQVALTVALALLGSYHAPVWDKTQQINVTFVLAPGVAGDHRSARVSFDRYLTNNQGQLWRTQLVTDQKIYEQFYQDLDKSLAEDNGAARS